MLAGGFGWYERSRPPARMVALVAALAALAVAGRLVLAPIPNVVATTDIVLITGYALGAAPGLRGRGAGGADLQHLARPGAVDAVGDGGLGPGRARRRRARRCSPGAAWAGSASPSPVRLAGFAYGALLDLSVMVTYGGEQSLDRYLAISARGVPFNVAHAAGNFVLALAAGPALVRMISRYRSRFEFTWRRRGRAIAVPASPRCRRHARGGGRARRAGVDREGRAGASRRRGGSSGRRTTTAASPPRPASRRARRSRAGRCSVSRPPGRNPLDLRERRAVADRPTCARRLDSAALDRRPRADDPRA